ncbi:hypothetical protein AM571_CH00673 [Rhizobium etli 8C-3]|uniref:Uncharacterized protein n=1 Tax=Rhizobium etli 8C-3 TaxID=538025 RepID=A0A1L5P050_RHIET|nr:hypothetical protein [Rhizobium etli]APO73519.1 hypothetical protein AM571_CH00673 [Rhizobium etli 8C-3]
MIRFESEIAKDDGQGLDARRLSARIAVTLVLAIAAYIGLLIGSNVIQGPPASDNNALILPGKETQPSHLTGRDAVRGILAADRKVAPKQTLHDFGPVPLPVPPRLEFAKWSPPAALPPIDTALRPAALPGNQPRAPPAA